MIITRAGWAVLEHDSHLSRWIEESGRIDHNENVDANVCKYFKEGDWVIDVGGSLGDHTVPYARKVGPNGRVFAFEPQPESFECLKHNTKNFPQVSIFPFALGKEEGTALLNRVHNIGASSIVTSKGAEPVSEVKVSTLDSISFERVDFIKVDAEGFDLFVLQGGINTIMKHRPRIQIEVSGHMIRQGVTANDINEFLKRINYLPDIPVMVIDGKQQDTLLTPQ